jgi:DNA repair protein RecO (recombination protein O)
VSTLHTHALVLRSVDFGESDRILHLLTPHTGRLTVIAKGARRSVKRFGGTLDFFNRLAVQVERRRPSAMARLDHARLLGAFHGIREHPTRFALGCYLLELLDRLAPEGAVGPRGGEMEHLFVFALEALRLVDRAEPDLRLRTLLELRALDALGLRPELTRCVRCAGPLDDGAEVGFHVAEGGPVCPRCRPPDHTLLSLHKGTLRALDRSLSFEPAQLGRLALGEVALREARTLLSRFLRFHVGIELRSERFLAERMATPPPRSLAPAGPAKPNAGPGD